MIGDVALWQSGLGFAALGLLLVIELMLHRRGFAKPDGDGDEIA
ncbi:MAG: hypothetical protein AAFN30_07785 [Actinomycetota bacterium]